MMFVSPLNCVCFCACVCLCFIIIALPAPNPVIMNFFHEYLREVRVPSFKDH